MSCCHGSLSTMMWDMTKKKILDENGSAKFFKLSLSEAAESSTADARKACAMISKARELRAKYRNKSGDLGFSCDENSPRRGVLSSDSGAYELVNIADQVIKDDLPTMGDFVSDYRELISIRNSGACKTLCHKRLTLLETTFEIHKSMNGDREMALERASKTDFYGIHKVDTHVHAAAAVAAPDILSFIKKKVKNCGDDVVDGERTLKEVYDSVGVPLDELTVDAIDIAADATLFNRFDHFNAKSFEKLRHHHQWTWAEYRLSIYGDNIDAWDKLAKWALNNKLVQQPHNRWLIQIPRIKNIFSQYIYRIFHKLKKVTSYQEVIYNIFQPLFDATEKPKKYPELSEFLKDVSGFDSVDDESLLDLPLATIDGKVTTPKDWTSEQNPPYSYQLYYLYANISRLNSLRRSKGMNTFSLRPHAGESGSKHHLCTTYLLANGINHGIGLANDIVMQYLYYLDNIGLAVSPVSNNVLFMRYEDQPFYKFFKRGLNVSLSTDDPMIFHLSDAPLLEEYSIARQIWCLSTTDISEIARNSVIQSGFPKTKKQKWLGGIPTFEGYEVTSNDPDKTNVNQVRWKFRCQRKKEEETFVFSVANLKLKEAETTVQAAKEEERSSSLDMAEDFAISTESTIIVGEADKIAANA